MKLSHDEKQQSGIIKTKAYLLSRLDTLRCSNDEIIPEMTRCALIGEIEAVKRLLKFIATKPVVVPDTSNFDD